MIIIKGSTSEATIFTDNIEENAIEQINTMCDSEYARGSQIRIMPDVHAGNNCTIGTVMSYKDRIAPTLVGCDIGCGMLVINLNKKGKDLDLVEIDNYIHETQPTQEDLGSRLNKDSVNKSVHEGYYIFGVKKDIERLKCFKAINEERVAHTFATIGGGNHFIEIEVDEEDNAWLIVHSGSRSLGKYIEKYYTLEAVKQRNCLSVRDVALMETEVKNIVESYKKLGLSYLINSTIKELVSNFIEDNKPNYDKTNAFLTGYLLENYLHDMRIAQEYASLNRFVIGVDIYFKINGYSNKDIEIERFDTVHNYIDIENRILHKGSVSAKKGELMIIPMNMRDGSLLCVGKGNKNWLESAPHGAGRLLSRSEASKGLSLSKYEKDMLGVYTTSVCQETLDESPDCYKSMDEIIKAVEPTVEVLKVLKSIYNYKNK